MRISGVHILPKENQWVVQEKGVGARRFSTQKEAILHGKQQAKKHHTELFIHRRDFRIRDRLSYGNDPRSSKG